MKNVKLIILLTVVLLTLNVVSGFTKYVNSFKETASKTPNNIINMEDRPNQLVNMFATHGHCNTLLQLY